MVVRRRGATVMIGLALAVSPGLEALHAQPAASSTPPIVGLVGGLSSAKIVISTPGASISFDSRTGFVAGMSLRKVLDDALSLEADGLYVQQGFEASSGDNTSRLNIDYLEFPVLLRYRLGSSSTFPFIAGGVALAYKASCTGAISAGGVSVSEGCGQDVNTWDYGLLVGGGISSEALSGSLRYFWGQGDIVDDANASMRNRVLMVMLGYQLGGASRRDP